jgi:shikimate kinase
MKIIVIGPSLAGKTTIARHIQLLGNIHVSEIDEELTKLNNGNYPSDEKYKNSILAPKVIEYVLNQDDIVFLTNTNYFTDDDLKTAKSKGFKIYILDLDIQELKRRNMNRVEKEGYSDMNKWLEGMVLYQNRLKEGGLVDKVIDATQSTENIISEILFEKI